MWSIKAENKKEKEEVTWAVMNCYVSFPCQIWFLTSDVFLNHYNVNQYMQFFHFSNTTDDRFWLSDVNLYCVLIYGETLIIIIIIIIIILIDIAPFIHTIQLKVLYEKKYDECIFPVSIYLHPNVFLFSMFCCVIFYIIYCAYIFIYLLIYFRIFIIHILSFFSYRIRLLFLVLSYCQQIA